jgi:hypothetical protein
MTTNDASPQFVPNVLHWIHFWRICQPMHDFSVSVAMRGCVILATCGCALSCWNTTGTILYMKGMASAFKTLFIYLWTFKLPWMTKSHHNTTPNHNFPALKTIMFSDTNRSKSFTLSTIDKLTTISEFGFTCSSLVYANGDENVPTINVRAADVMSKNCLCMNAAL